jgi:hypothetical protein
MSLMYLKSGWFENELGTSTASILAGIVLMSLSILLHAL